MLIAILSDIHANREALEACLDDAEASRAEAYVFLGDLVGYGGDPAYVVDIVRRYAEAGAAVLMGNHDAAIETGGLGMNEPARVAIEWTRGQLDRSQRDFLAGLPLEVRDKDILFVHADASLPRAWRYVLSREEAQRSMAATDARITICGHVHRPQLYAMLPSKAVISYAIKPDTPMPLSSPQRWLAVLGAVGQPRDRDPAARYALLDDTAHRLTFRRVPYDIEGAAGRIISAGLPIALAHRLFVGL